MAVRFKHSAVVVTQLAKFTLVDMTESDIIANRLQCAAHTAF